MQKWHIHLCRLTKEHREVSVGRETPVSQRMGAPTTTVTTPQLYQESFSPVGWSTTTHCVNGEAFWSALQSKGIAACMDMAYIKGCKERTFWNCIGQYGIFREESAIGKGRDWDSLGRNKCGRENH